MVIPYPISSRALAYVRYRAELMMRYQCQVERVQLPTYDHTTLIASPGTHTTIYLGPCRIRDISGEVPVLVGDVDVVIQQTFISLPWNMEVIPARNDEILITQIPAGGDESILGKRFQIQNNSKAGDLRATRGFAVITMESGR